MTRSIRLTLLTTAALLLLSTVTYAIFTNGGFETGDFSGWTKSAFLNPGLAGAQPYTEASIVRNAGGVDRTTVETAAGPLAASDPIVAAAQYPRFGTRAARVNYHPTGSNPDRVANSLLQTATVAAGRRGPRRRHRPPPLRLPADSRGRQSRVQPAVVVLHRDPQHHARDHGLATIHVRRRARRAVAGRHRGRRQLHLHRLAAGGRRRRRRRHRSRRQRPARGHRGRLLARRPPRPRLRRCVRLGHPGRHGRGHRAGQRQRRRAADLRLPRR